MKALGVTASAPAAQTASSGDSVAWPATGRTTRLLVLLLAFACGASVANIYYAQPLLPEISRTFAIGHGAAALVVAVTQIGYAIGLAFLMPLGDLVENRRLTSRTLLATAAALVAACLAPDFGVLIAAAALVGVTSVVAQILMPVAAHLAPDHARGKYVGIVTSGLLLGIMLARSLASFAAVAWGWRSIYGISAALMILTATALRRFLPRTVPHHRAGYRSLLTSIIDLARTEPVLRRRALAQALMFATFTAFWTAIVYQLAGSAHHLGPGGIAVFALVGAAGAAAAPIAGRAGDAGHGAITRLIGFILAGAAMILAALTSSSLIWLAVAAVLLDVAAQLNHVLSMRDVYALRPDARARVNSVYMTTMFIGGAASSAITGAVDAAWGWTGVCVFGAALATLGALFWVTGPASTR